jgi:glycosyltransferase involved in cell wall biosynthesis
MRIAQVAPLFESVPPVAYGGTERVVANLVEELIDLGHEVTLFSSGDSRCRAEIVPVCPRALRLDARCRDHLAWHVLLIERVMQQADRFDIVHFHTGHLHFPIARRLGVPHVTTMHGRLDFAELAPLHVEFSEVPLVSISNSQREPLPEANWVATIPHGLADTLRPSTAPGSYFAFLGRICPEKGIDRAIHIATALNQPLKVAAKVDPADVRYFEQEIKPLLDNPLIEFIGEIGEDQKSEFLGQARALLFPIDWPEPFGLVMIESLACGTPVVAFRNGSVPEIIDDQHTGFIVDTIEEAIAAARCVHRLGRAACRQAFEQRFTARRMAEQYAATYTRMITTHRSDAAA